MRYLFCIMANYGYLYPALGLAKQLQQRGHQVGFVTDAAFSAFLQQSGVLYLPRDDKGGASFDQRYWGDSAEILRQIQHVYSASELFKPDVLVASQLAMGPLIAAKAKRLPVAVIGFGTYLWPKRHINPDHQSDLDRERALMHNQTLKAYFQAKARILGPSFYSAAPGDALYQNTPLLGDLYLLRSVPELEPDCDQLPAKVKLVGDCLWEPESSIDPELAEFVAQAKASKQQIIYVQYQSAPMIPDYWPNLVRALRNKAIAVVAASGGQLIDQDDIPANFFVRPHISHQVILPHVDAVMTSGTSSTMLGALRHGLPLLLLPYTSENPEVALRCERAGVAVVLSPFNRYTGTPCPENVTSGALTKALEQLLDKTSGPNRAAKKMKEHFSKIREGETAVSLLEQLGRETQIEQVENHPFALAPA